ncbi:DUF4913 domain-containing protein [Streptomyces neyagawaensis]|uniref:DUF4913 domain-containing protein n=1 Tax=Streptomyces neyagawaensis TaxID=42238 RepID=A0ABV3AW95_9ACTN
MTSPSADTGREEFPEEFPEESVEDIRRDEESAARPAELFYGNVGEFVTDRFVYFVSRPAPGSGRVWCPEWYRHPEALSRLDALWRAWEALRWDAGLGLSNWWVHHFDPTVRALLDPVTGPFAQCADGHSAPEPLLVETPPATLFDDQRLPTSRNPFALD